MWPISSILEWFWYPTPTYENVIPNGEGYYRYKWGKWRKVDERDDDTRFLSQYQLTVFAIDAVIALRKERGK